MFVLTHHPEDAVPAEGVTFLNCDVADGLRPVAEVDVRYHPVASA